MSEEGRQRWGRATDARRSGRPEQGESQWTGGLQGTAQEEHVLLEAELAEWIGCRAEQVVACASGTAALHLAMEALQLPSGSKVLVPDFTMVACPRAVSLAGMTPVFVDWRDEDLLIDPEAASRAVDRNVRAVMAVHVYGRRCAMDELHDLAKTDQLLVIEDLAEAHGICPHAGTDAACWSFYRNKVVAGEEGGAVSFLDPGRASLARSLRSLGFTEAHDFRHLPRGHNYRMSPPHATAVRRSLKQIDANLAARRQLVELHDDECPDGWRQPPRAVPWVYDVRVRGMDHHTQNAVVRALNEAGIAARHGFQPMSRQLEYRHHQLFGSGSRTYQEAGSASSEVFYLPLAPGTMDDTVAATWEVIREVLG